MKTEVIEDEMVQEFPSIDDDAHFRFNLVTLLNQHNMENRSNTPDWILRNYLCDCLRAFDVATVARTAFVD